MENKKTDETIIVISTEKMRKESINAKVNNYFLDVTYKIIPSMHKSYKLLTISSYNELTKITNINYLVLIKYEDYMSFYLTFKYLNINFNFNLKYIHIDFSQAERKALLQKNLFKKVPVIISCFFHFTQCIIKK